MGCVFEPIILGDEAGHEKVDGCPHRLVAVVDSEGAIDFVGIEIVDDTGWLYRPVGMEGFG